MGGHIILKQIINKDYQKIKQFVVVGISAAVINLGLVYLFIEISGLDTYVLRNFVNIITMVISTLYAFYLNRRWTWHSIPKKRGKQLLKQYAFYNLITAGGMTVRVILFASLDLLGLYHLFNVALGIGVAATFNYLMFDKHIFRKECSCEFK